MNDPSRQPWLLNPALRIHDTGGGRKTVELDDRDGRTLRLSVSDQAFELLQRFRRPTPWSDVRDELHAAGTDSARLSSIERLLSESCLARRILVRPDEETHAVVQPARPAYMGFMLELIRPSLANRLSAVLRPLFSTPLMILGGLAAAAGLGALFHAMHAIEAKPALTALQTLHVFGIGAIGVLLHELGHAAAAYRLGARRVSIGVGWYTVLPVAYADLSEIWRYPARERVVVDVAGVYMQGLLVATLMILDRLWANPVWLVAAAATATSMLWNLNPLLRMDGYWIAADAFGIPDLRRRAARQLSLAIRRLLNGKRPPGPQESPLIALYGLLCALFFFILLVRAAVFLAETLAVSLPGAARRIDASTLSALTVPEWILIALGAAWNVLFFCFALRLLASLVRRIAAYLSESGRAGA